MSIRFKILVGCLSLTFITLIMGAFAQHAQQSLGTIATRIYDEAFMAVSYLREAQNGLMELNLRLDKLERAREPAAASDFQAAEVLAASVPDILGSLEVAEDRAMSPEGARATAALRADIERLGAAPDGASYQALIAGLEEIQDSFDIAVEIYAGDGYAYRQSAVGNIERSAQQTWIVVLLSVVIAFVITFLLSRSIVPALREVVRIAKSIAGGRLDNTIARRRDRSESGEMLEALAAMQGSIAANLARIKALMAEQASSHAGEMAVQHRRFAAALENMTQGLCLFDADGRLIIFNRRFREMFGEPAADAGLKTILSGQGLEPPADLDAQPTFMGNLPDGRVIAVVHRRVEDGGWVATYEDVTERRQIEARFAHMARHDSLTGLPNRVLFREHIEQALGRARSRAFSVLSLDLDGFKTINDTLGHHTGDAVLRLVAERLRTGAPEAGIVARLGGDEFVLIQPGTGDAIPALAQHLLEALREPFDIDAHHIVIGASIGIAATTDLADPAAASAADTLLKNADLALHRAKNDGRGTYRFFEAEMDARLQARRSLELDLRTALERNEFELHYQPLVDTRKGRVAGFEALLRWRHPTRGTVSPAEFIPLAEETGLIRAIGSWVLHAACREAASWPADVTVAVNLSPVQFGGSDDLVEIVSDALLGAGLEAGRLELEITESLLLQDSMTVLETLHQLRQLGTRIAMDDFGTGYSSLSYLQRFPFDKIKIDQGFVRQLSDRRDSTAIVRAVIGLGRSLGMSILAEGVETAEQLAILQAEGCWDVQGYLFSPPRPASRVPGLLRTIGARKTRTRARARPAV